MEKNNKIQQEIVQVRYAGLFTEVPVAEVTYADVSSKQMIGVSAALIPFLEHDDANRALMGANMMRQAVPLLINEAPVIATGMEMEVPKSSSMVVMADEDGTVTSVDAKHVTVGAHKYDMRKFHGLNERTCL